MSATDAKTTTGTLIDFAAFKQLCKTNGTFKIFLNEKGMTFEKIEDENCSEKDELCLPNRRVTMFSKGAPIDFLFEKVIPALWEYRNCDFYVNVVSEKFFGNFQDVYEIYWK